MHREDHTNLVSIIMPAYNAGLYISETINSVISQSYPHWELFIINDGSTDNTKAIIEEYALKETRISQINKNNSGVSETRNIGIDKAQGKFLAFLDADDVWNSNNLEEKINFLNENPIDAVYSSYELIDTKSVSSNLLMKGNDTNLLRDLLLTKGNFITAPSGLVLKTEIVKKIGGFDLNLSNNADQDLIIQLLVNNYKIGYLNKTLWKYRIHSGNMSKNVALLEKDTLYIFKKLTRQKVFGSFWFKQRCFAKMYLMLAGSWWKEGGNKPRGIFFILLSVAHYPLVVLKLLNKLRRA